MPGFARHGVYFHVTNDREAGEHTDLPFRLDYTRKSQRICAKRPAVWSYSYDGADAHSIYTLYKDTPGYVLGIDSQGKGTFTYRDGSITAHWEPGGTGPEHYLNGIGLAVWLERRGVTCLHANVLATGGGAYGLIGGSTVGKSTLTASLLARGHSFLSDDMLALHEKGNDYLAYPSEARLKLWPDAIEACGLGSPEQWPRIHKHFDKRLLDIAQIPGMEICAKPRRLRALYILERGQSSDGHPILKRLSPTESLIAMVTHSAALDIPAALGMEAERFTRLGRLVGRVPVKRLRAPPHLASLSGVCEIIERDMGLTA